VPFTKGVEPQNKTPEVPPLQNRHLTEDDLALRWVMSVRSLKRLLAAGRGPKPLRIGRAVRFRLAEVERWEAQVERRGGVKVFDASAA
jgi:predicted DNA-binding transcriptional regulator AlpA